MSVNLKSIHFEKVQPHHQKVIFKWLDELHIQEFWDNSQEHRDDIINFINGRKEKSTYFGGSNTYWIGFVDNQPYSFILTHEEESNTFDLSDYYRPYLSKEGKTWGLDFCIGNKNYLGKGLATPTLNLFMKFIIKHVDRNVDIFFIDPFIDNPRAIYVYKKAGFKIVSEFIQDGGYFDQKKGLLMVKQVYSEPILLPATPSDYYTLQNMARFYVYDRTKYLGWECPENGLFECIDFKHYFEMPDKRAFLVKVNNELAGFVLLDKIGLTQKVDWNMGEFFILAKFQQMGMGSQIAKEIFTKFQGKWSVGVMPENISAVNFWRKIINEVSLGKFTEIFKTAEELIAYDNADPYPMIIFSFNME